MEAVRGEHRSEQVGESHLAGLQRTRVPEDHARHAMDAVERGDPERIGLALVQPRGLRRIYRILLAHGPDEDLEQRPRQDLAERVRRGRVDDASSESVARG